jgi:MFS family permease
LISGEFGGSPLVIGLIMSTASIATAITSARLGVLARRFSEKTLLAAGYVFFAVSLASVPFASNTWKLIPPAIIYGVGSGLNIPNIIGLLARFAPLNQRAAVMSINGMVLRLGQTLGPVIMAAVYAAWGLNAVFYAGAIFTLGMCVLAVIMIRQPEDRGAQRRPA